MAYETTTEFLQSQATEALNAARNNASRIYSLPPPVTLREPSVSHTPDEIDIGPPPSFGDLFQDSDSTGPTIEYLNTISDQWIQKYFPSINGCLRTVPDDWLCGVIGGTKPYGTDQTVFEVTWQRFRDRTYRANRNDMETLAARTSAGGFSLPTGAMVDAMIEADQRGRDAILQANVEQMIKDADIKAELLRTAVTTAASYRLGIMESLVTYYRSWADLQDKDIERARIRAQAFSALYSALGAYYNVEVSFEQLRLQSEQLKAEVSLGVDRNRLTQQSNFAPTAGGLATAVSAFANLAGQSNIAGGSLTAEIETN